MDVTKMMHMLPESTHTHLFLLLEGGAQTSDAFQAFYNEHASSLYSLYLHPQVAEFRGATALYLFYARFSGCYCLFTFRMRFSRSAFRGMHNYFA